MLVDTDLNERLNTNSTVLPKQIFHHPTRPKRQATRYQNKSFPTFGEEQKQSNKGNIQLPVDVRRSKTSVIKFPNKPKSKTDTSSFQDLNLKCKSMKA